MAQYALQSVNAGQPGLAASLGEKFLKKGLKTFGHTDQTYIAGVSNLGLAYYALGQYADAEEVFRAALEAHGAMVGSNLLDGSKIRLNLARAIKAQGAVRSQEAEQLLVEGSSQLEYNLGYLHRDTLSSLAMRALLIYSGPGAHMPSNDLVQIRKTILTITKEFLGSQHPDTLATIANYANCLAISGSWVEAKSLYEEVLLALHGVSSDTQLQRMDIMSNFAVSCSRNDELDKAEKLILDALSILRGKRLPIGPSFDMIQFNLAILMDVYRLRGDTEKAEILLQIIWESAKDGLSNMIVLTSVRNMAVSWLDGDQRASEARDLLLELLEVLTKRNGPKHLETMITRNEVAECFNRQRQYSEAERMHSETMKICLEEFGPKYSTTILVMQNLAMIYQAQLKMDKAADLMYQVYLAEAEVLGPSHNDTVLSAGSVAAMHRYSGADHNPDMFPGVFDPRKRLEGTDRDSIEAKLRLAASYQELDHVDEALEIAQGAVRACKRRFGDTDQLTLYAWRRLADTLHTAFLKSGSSSQLERANDIASFVFKEHNKILGEYHDVTSASETLLGIILRDQELYAEAERHFKHSLVGAEMLSGENVYAAITVLTPLLGLYEKQGKHAPARNITDRIANLQKEMEQNQNYHINPEDTT